MKCYLKTCCMTFSISTTMQGGESIHSWLRAYHIPGVVLNFDDTSINKTRSSTKRTYDVKEDKCTNKLLSPFLKRSHLPSLPPPLPFNKPSPHLFFATCQSVDIHVVISLALPILHCKLGLKWVPYNIPSTKQAA